MAEIRAKMLLKEDLVRETAEALGLRVKKSHRRISWEEFNERWFKGICMFCDELETPDHHHKNSGILMVDCDEDKTRNDEALVENEFVTESDGIEQQTVNNEENSNENLDILEEESITQIQVPISSLKSSLQSHNASSDICDDFKSSLFGHREAMLQVSHVKVRDELLTKSTDVTNNQAAHYLFDKMPLRVQSKRRHIKCHKSWRFKFKHRVASRESKAGFEVNMKHNQSKEMLLQLLLSGTHKKRQRKTPKYHKTWKFRFKNMELQRIMTQLDTQHFIFRWDSECIIHLSTVVHHLETSHKQSSFAIDALKSDFGVDVIIFHGEQQFGCRVVMLHLKKRGTYEFSGQLQDSSNVEAESFPFLNFAAEQPLLWMQNNAKPILIVSELEREKKKLCYKTWMFKYKAPLKRVQFLHYCDKEVPIETNWAVQRIWDKDSPEVDIIDAYSVLQDVSEMVNKQLLKTILVIQQVMRNKKIKFSKRWWFKYKYVEEGVKRLHNQLRYKCLLELEERFKIWSRRESWRKHKEVQQFMATKEEMEVGMKENDQKQRGDWGHYFLLLAAANWSPQMHLWSTSYRVWHRWKARWFLVGMISTMRAWLFGEEGFDIGKEMRRGHMK